MIEVRRYTFPSFDDSLWASLLKTASMGPAFVIQNEYDRLSHTVENEVLIALHYDRPDFQTIGYWNVPGFDSKWFLGRDGSLIVRNTAQTVIVAILGLFFGITLIPLGGLLYGLIVVAFAVGFLLDSLSLSKEAKAFIDYIELHRQYR